MELAILHPSFGAVGGAEVLAVAEARALRADGIDARIVTASVDAARWREARDGIPVARYRQRTIRDAVAWTTVAGLRMQARRALHFVETNPVRAARMRALGDAAPDRVRRQFPSVGESGVRGRRWWRNRGSSP